MKWYFWIQAVGSRSRGPNRIGRRSNLGRLSLIGWLRAKGRPGRRRSSQETCSRGGAAPEKAKLGLPGADSSGAEVSKHLHGTRDLQVALAKLGEVWSSGFVGGGGPARRRLVSA